MPRHTNSVELPRAQVISKDAVITVRGDGRIIGTLTISRGNIEWYSNRWKISRRVSWRQFDRKMRED